MKWMICERAKKRMVGKIVEEKTDVDDTKIGDRIDYKRTTVGRKTERL